MSKILVVEDDPVLGSHLTKWLKSERHMVELTADGADAISILKNYNFDLIILDWLLPNFSGVEICRTYRGMGGKSSVLMLTSKVEIQAKEEGLDAGADDYLSKPFHPREFSARVRALLRRQSAYVDDVLKSAGLELNKPAHRVTLDGEEVKLLPLEFSLLEFFMRHPNQIFSKESILERVWPAQSEATVEVVRTYIKSLRKKIEKNPEQRFISNVHSVGYVFGKPEQ